MEGRKLQLTGGSTFIVSLPKHWVVERGLKAGDTVFLAPEADGSVTLRAQPVEHPSVRRKIFDQGEDETRDHLLRKLIGAYISGFELIEVRFRQEQGPFVRRVAREFCRLAIGPEIVEETRTSLTLQDLSDPTELSSEKCLRRMHLTVRAMLEDAIQSLRAHDDALARDVIQRDQDVDRLYWMVAKQYHLAHTIVAGSMDLSTKAAIHSHRLIAKLLERIGDHAERIAHAEELLAEGRGLDARLSKELEAAKTSAVATLDRAVRSFFTGNIDDANSAIDARASHQKLIDSLSHQVATRKGEELLALGTVVDSLGRTVGYAADIAEQAINLAVLTD